MATRDDEGSAMAWGDEPEGAQAGTSGRRLLEGDEAPFRSGRSPSASGSDLRAIARR